jgi:hypothetical protein
MCAGSHARSLSLMLTAGMRSWVSSLRCATSPTLVSSVALPPGSLRSVDASSTPRKRENDALLAGSSRHIAARPGPSASASVPLEQSRVLSRALEGSLGSRIARFGSRWHPHSRCAGLETVALAARPDAERSLSCQHPAAAPCPAPTKITRRRRSCPERCYSLLQAGAGCRRSICLLNEACAAPPRRELGP